MEKPEEKEEKIEDIVQKIINGQITEIKDMNMMVEVSERKLTVKKNENELLKIEIDNLSKLLAITEEENKLMNETDNNKNPKKISNNDVSKINNKKIVKKKLKKMRKKMKKILILEWINI